MEKVRAIIIKETKILTIKRTKAGEVYWVLPGGSVEENENHEQALKREVKEELGLEVEINKFIVEIKLQEKNTKEYKEYFYNCNIVSGKIGTGNGPEYQPENKYIGSYDIEWLDLDDLVTIELRPTEIKQIILNTKI